MVVSFCLKSRGFRRLLSVIMICSLLPGSFVWGALQPPLSKVTNPVFGTSGGSVPATIPPNLSPYVKDVTAAIRLGKALFWDMQVGSDGVTACASCHYRAGADPVAGTLPKETARRDKNQLHPGPDAIFGNSSTVIRTFQQGGFDPVTLEPLPVVDPVTLLPVPVILRASGFPLDPNVPGGASRFAPNYTLNTAPDPLVIGDFPLFLMNPSTARLVIDPLNGGLTSDAVFSLRDTNDVVGSQGVRLAQFNGIGAVVDLSTPLTDQLFRLNGANIRQVTNRNAPSVINAVFNFTNFWDGRANNIFNGSTPFGPLDQNAGIWVDDNVNASLVPQKIAIPNSSLASQAVGQAVSDGEMSFKGRTFPELGRKMLALAPLATQFVHPQDSVLGAPLSNATLQLDGSLSGSKGVNIPDYRTMVEAAFVDTLWNSGKTVNLPATISGIASTDNFTQIEANFSFFWGLAIQLYEATLVSDRAPFDRFQAGNRNALNASEQVGFTNFDSKCTLCHSGTEFSSAVVGSNNCPVTTLVTDCNRVAFTNNSTHRLIKQDVPIFEPGAPPPPPPSLFDAGFFNIGVRPTTDDPGRGGKFVNPLTTQEFPLSFTRLAVQASQTGLPFVTPKLPLPPPDKVQGTFKTPGLRNVELTAPYFHNGEALTLAQVVEFYTRGGNFPGNSELAVAMQPIGNLRKDPARRGDIVAFLKKLTDERVRNETAPFDHPELMIPNGTDAGGADLPLITLPATGGAEPPVQITALTINPVTSPTNLTTLVISGTVDDTATVAVDVTNTTTGVILPTLVAAVGGTVGGVVGGVAQLPTDWSVNLTRLTPGLHTITVTATSITGATTFATGLPAVVTSSIQITPTAIISGTPLGGRTKQSFATLTIGGAGVDTYQYSVDGAAYSADTPLPTPITLTNLPDGTHTVAVLAKDMAGNQQPIVNATTATWFVKANPPVLTLDPTSSPTGSGTQTLSGTIEPGSFPAVSVDTGAMIGTVNFVGGIGIDNWSCEITALAAGTNNITVSALDALFNETIVKGSITRILPDGNMVEDGVTDIKDALKALRIAVDLEQATVTDILHGDIAPLVNGLPTQNNLIDIADALLILRKTVGLVTF